VPSPRTHRGRAQPDGRSATGAPGARLHALLQRKQRQLANLALADTVFAPSQFLADVFAENGFRHDGFKIGHYGLETQRIVAIPTERPRQPLRLGFCGVLSPWKGAHVVVEAVRNTTAAVHLTVNSRTEEHLFQDYIDGVLKAAEGDDHITFAGPYQEAEASRVFADMDVLIVASTWYENTPLVMFDAFAAGVPVIISDLGGMSEMIAEKNGLVFTTGDAAALQRQIERVAGDPSWFEGLEVHPLPGIGERFDRYRVAYND